MVWFLLYLLIQSSLCLCWDCNWFQTGSSWSLVQYQLNLISFVVAAVLRSVSSVRSQANEGSLWWQSHLTTHFNQTRVFLLWSVISGTETLHTRVWNVSDIRHGSSLTARLRCIGVCLCFGLICQIGVCLYARNTKHQQRGSQKHAAVWWRMCSSQIWAGLSPHQHWERLTAVFSCFYLPVCM